MLHLRQVEEKTPVTLVSPGGDPRARYGVLLSSKVRIDKKRTYGYTNKRTRRKLAYTELVLLHLHGTSLGKGWFCFCPQHSTASITSS